LPAKLANLVIRDKRILRPRYAETNPAAVNTLPRRALSAFRFPVVLCKQFYYRLLARSLIRSWKSTPSFSTTCLRTRPAVSEMPGDREPSAAFDLQPCLPGLPPAGGWQAFQFRRLPPLAL